MFYIWLNICSNCCYWDLDWRITCLTVSKHLCFSLGCFPIRASPLLNPQPTTFIVSNLAWSALPPSELMAMLTYPHYCMVYYTLLRHVFFSCLFYLLSHIEWLSNKSNFMSFKYWLSSQISSVFVLFVSNYLWEDG